MTERKPAGPAWNVEIEFSLGHPNYVNLVQSMYGPDSLDWWEELGDLLGGRSGWHCDFTSEGLLWSFGAMGSSLFNVSPVTAESVAEDDEAEPYVWNRGYELFDYEADNLLNFGDTTELREWLEENEARHAEHLRSLNAFVRGNEWSDLSRFEWDARVTHDSSTFIGVVPKVPSEMVAGPDLPSVLTGLQELMAHAFGAPHDAARHVRLNVRLDTKATAALL